MRLWTGPMAVRSMGAWIALNVGCWTLDLWLWLKQRMGKLWSNLSHWSRDWRLTVGRWPTAAPWSTSPAERLGRAPGAKLNGVCSYRGGAMWGTHQGGSRAVMITGRRHVMSLGLLWASALAEVSSRGRPVMEIGKTGVVWDIDGRLVSVWLGKCCKGAATGARVARVWFGENEQKRLLSQVFTGERGRTVAEQRPKTYLDRNWRSVQKMLSNGISSYFLLALIKNSRYNLDMTP
jgi:hypothetical protein